MMPVQKSSKPAAVQKQQLSDSASDQYSDDQYEFRKSGKNIAKGSNFEEIKHETKTVKISSGSPPKQRKSLQKVSSKKEIEMEPPMPLNLNSDLVKKYEFKNR